jgi:hypothetical protein
LTMCIIKQINIRRNFLSNTFVDLIRIEALPERTTVILNVGCRANVNFSLNVPSTRGDKEYVGLTTWDPPRRS